MFIIDSKKWLKVFNLSKIRLQKCIDVGGDYIEHTKDLVSLPFSGISEISEWPSYIEWKTVTKNWTKNYSTKYFLKFHDLFLKYLKF